MHTLKIKEKKIIYPGESLYNKSILSNGLTIITEQVPDTQSFALGFAVNTGSGFDAKGFEGISHFIEHILFRRTNKHSGKKIADEFESMGAYINAYTTKEMTCFYVRALNIHLRKCLQLLSELVFHPALRDGDIEKERNVILEEISSYEDDPEELIFDIGEGLVFKNSMLAHPIAGNLESVKNIGSKELRNFHDENYNSRNIILSYSGANSHQEICTLAEKLDIRTIGKRQKLIFPDKIIKKEKLVFDKQFQQSHILFIKRTEGFNSDDRYLLGIINIILGDGLSSRLNQLLRERHSLAYTVYSTLALLADTGTLGIYAAAEQKKLIKISDMINQEHANIIANGFSDKEISKAKEQLKSSTIMALEGLSARMQSNARLELSTGSHETVSETINLVDSIKREVVESAINKYLASDNWCEVILNGNKTPD